MSECDCGNSVVGKWLGKVGGQIGDRATTWGENVVSQGLKRFKNWTGLGDYTIHANSLISTGPGGQTAIIETRGRTIKVAFREYIGDVYTGSVVGGFNANHFTVNPANLKTFPWLSTVATQFEQYKPLGIIFEFKSTATDNSVGTSVGSIIISSDYDVFDAPPETKQQMLNTAYSSEAKMSNDMLHGIECAPSDSSRNIWYCRPNGATQLGDARDYDICTTTVATQGGSLPANSSIGSLYVHYEFEFYKECLFNGILNNGQVYAVYNGTCTSALFTFGGTAWTRVAGYDLDCEQLDVAQFRIPRMYAGGTFEVRVTVSGTATAGRLPAGKTGIDCTFPNPPSWGLSVVGTNYNRAPDWGATAGIHSMSFLVRLDEVMNNDKAIFYFSDLGLSNAAAGTWECTVEYHLVRRDYDSVA